jgi:hypothetical protein
MRRWRGGDGVRKMWNGVRDVETLRESSGEIERI